MNIRVPLCEATDEKEIALKWNEKQEVKESILIDSTKKWNKRNHRKIYGKSRPDVNKIKSENVVNEDL